MHQHRKRRSAVQGRKILDANQSMIQPTPLPLSFGDDPNDETMVEGHSFSSLEDNSFDCNANHMDESFGAHPSMRGPKQDAKNNRFTASVDFQALNSRKGTELEKAAKAVSS